MKNKKTKQNWPRVSWQSVFRCQLFVWTVVNPDSHIQETFGPENMEAPSARACYWSHEVFNSGMAPFSLMGRSIDVSGTSLSRIPMWVTRGNSGNSVCCIIDIISNIRQVTSEWILLGKLTSKIFQHHLTDKCFMATYYSLGCSWISSCNLHKVHLWTYSGATMHFLCKIKQSSVCLLLHSLISQITSQAVAMPGIVGCTGNTKIDKTTSLTTK